MKVAIYARYSSDQQRDASITDQFRMCRLRAEKEGWRVVEEYSDHSISGASMIQRPGIQALVMDSTRGRFDLVLAEALDRISRDQEDIAGIYKRMRYADVKMFTLSEGEISELHVGLKGTMNALFLKDLADKTRRGQRGRVEAGKSGGGNSYGYDVVKKFDGDGEPSRGDRTINAAQAEVVRRIFRDYAAGKSAKAIAMALNKDGIPAPSGGDWGFSTINGNPKRGNGILNNEMYVGRIVWNRQRFIKDPDTGKRQARPNPEEDWVIQEVPELRILDDDLWNAVKARQKTNTVARDARGIADVRKVNHRRRPKYLFSGLTKCACCGGGYSAISKELIGCSTARNKGTCDNRMNIRRDELESRVLNALRTRLVDPDLFAEFCDAYTRETNRLRMESGAGIDKAEAELKRIAREEEKLMDLYMRDAISIEAVKERGDKLRARKAELQDFLASTDEPPPLLHPSMALQYRARVQQLYETLQSDDETQRIEAAEIIRSLIDRIVLTPGEDRIEIDVQGDLAGILTLSAQRKNPAADAAGAQVKMVAGVGFEPTTFRL
ncbi:recombinase family protein [Paracoccus denitrificans]|uniref:Recombinase n=3 Tax=Paracoccus TaxID=265 RepID=A1B6R0_PARDP|nr:recombinase family protein [Paracoccus denitrificans]ABL71204.1 Recombinase [Paracoccus denitrificans PD1222]MCU7429256.1 recombinase family protein [Paracoccus denitrificans]QAR27845.1 recombinase family protein [Paracoccus denitrificans]UPV97557.1 recombinase family protein [Paracoccus denitrificans]WQO35469.1 recombinase family protein [Paracoccus denitrificans]